MIKPNSYKNPKHVEKSLKNKLKKIKEWIYENHAVIYKFSTLANCFLLNITLQINQTYIISIKRQHKNEQVYWVEKNLFTDTIIECLATSGF